jgi:hypothetical protein
MSPWILNGPNVIEDPAKANLIPCIANADREDSTLGGCLEQGR